MDNVCYISHSNLAAWLKEHNLYTHNKVSTWKSRNTTTRKVFHANTNSFNIKHLEGTSIQYVQVDLDNPVASSYFILGAVGLALTIKRPVWAASSVMTGVVIPHWLPYNSGTFLIKGKKFFIWNRLTNLTHLMTNNKPNPEWMFQHTMKA